MTKTVGRPRKLLSPKDYKTFEKLASLMCSQREIAAVLNMDFRTLKNAVEEYTKEDFCTVYEKAQSAGVAKLRSTLFKHASKNPVACIFACKNYAGMKDNIPSSQESEKTKVVIHE